LCWTLDGRGSAADRVGSRLRLASSRRLSLYASRRGFVRDVPSFRFRDRSPSVESAKPSQLRSRISWLVMLRANCTCVRGARYNQMAATVVRSGSRRSPCQPDWEPSSDLRLGSADR
jgi:hypothetical protein